MLPFATSTHAKVCAERGHALCAWLGELYYMPFGKTVFFAVNLNVGHIARGSVWDEYHQIAPPGNAFAFGCHSRDFKSFYNG